MKKIVSVLLVLTMLIGLTACGSNSKEGAESDGEKETSNVSETLVESVSDEDAVPKIGIIIWGTTDALGRNSTMMVEKLVKQAGGEVVVDTSATSPETQIQSAENLISAGCNGILVVNNSDQMLPKLGQICEENKVHWGLMWRRIVSEEVDEQVKDLEYFVGYTAEDEIEISERLAQDLSDEGFKEVALIAGDVGDTTHDMRVQGLANITGKTDLEQVAEYRGASSAPEVMEAVEKFIIGFPELDAIFMTGATQSQLEGALAALEKHNKRGEIVIAAIDFIDAELMKEYLDDGTIFRIAGGHYVDPVFTASMVVNAIQGNKLSENYEAINLKFVDFSGSEDAVNYYEFVENDADNIYAYTEEELAQMIVSNNPDFTIEQLKQIADSYSIQDVMDRHGN